MESRNEIIEACKTQLAINFDIPAKSILSFYGSKLNLTWQEMDSLLRSRIAK